MSDYCGFCYPDNGRELLSARAKGIESNIEMSSVLFMEHDGQLILSNRLGSGKLSNDAKISINYCPFCGRFIHEVEYGYDEPISVFTKILESEENPEKALNEITFECEKIEKRIVAARYKRYFRKMREAADDPEHNNPGI